jgi:hypothetical protein
MQAEQALRSGVVPRRVAISHCLSTLRGLIDTRKLAAKTGWL